MVLGPLMGSENAAMMRVVRTLKSLRALRLLRTFRDSARLVIGKKSLKLTAKAHENPHENPGKYHQNGGFSMAMLALGRVYPWLCDLGGMVPLGWGPRKKINP